jgi:hypothetical protein
VRRLVADGRPLFVCLPSKCKMFKEKKGKKGKNEKREKTQHFLFYFLLPLFFISWSLQSSTSSTQPATIFTHSLQEINNCNSNKTKSAYSLHA